MSDMEETEGTEGPVAPHRVIGTPPPSPRLLGSTAVDRIDRGCRRSRAHAVHGRRRGDRRRAALRRPAAGRPEGGRARQAGRAGRRGLLHARVLHRLRLRGRLRRHRRGHGRQDPAVQPGPGHHAGGHAAAARHGRADLGPAPDAGRRADRGAARPALRRGGPAAVPGSLQGRRSVQPVRQAAADQADADAGHAAAARRAHRAAARHRAEARHQPAAHRVEPGPPAAGLRHQPADHPGRLQRAGQHDHDRARRVPGQRRRR